jgi:23S rRNA (cytosine1962-C5)-methyltransferase
MVSCNTAGVDRYRLFLKDLYDNLTNKPVFFWDSEKKRSLELLPKYGETIDLGYIEIIENNFNYKVSLEKIQKNGWYFDHRENRLKIERILSQMKELSEHGLDLFCYQGAWGMHLLRAGVGDVLFVDQADMGKTIESNLKLNGFKNQEFVRDNVFDFLDECIQAERKFGVVVSDPPAFAKSEAEKKNAIDGYSKLHKKIFKILSPGSVVVFASCTYYVSESELEKTILHAARENKRDLKLLDRGLQAFDHPFDAVESKNNYIKCFIYYVE